MLGTQALGGDDVGSRLPENLQGVSFNVRCGRSTLNELFHVELPLA